MKRIILLTLVLAYLAVSCSVIKDNNIYVDHSKEKDKYKISKKNYNPGKNCKNSWR
jgi:hypothetical protein